jgi:hypothetical protein
MIPLLISILIPTIVFQIIFLNKKCSRYFTSGEYIIFIIMGPFMFFIISFIVFGIFYIKRLSDSGSIFAISFALTSLLLAISSILIPYLAGKKPIRKIKRNVGNINRIVDIIGFIASILGIINFFISNIKK